jgi:hypothetical protein
VTVWMEKGNLADSTLAAGQAFVLRMLLRAFATAGADPDIRRAAHALSSSEARIITGFAA